MLGLAPLLGHYEAKTAMIVGSVHVEDLNSGIMEASGVRMEFTSADEISTVTAKTMAYVDGNFMRKTGFVSRIGPFASGTTVLARIVALDTLDNSAASRVYVVKVPKNAKAVQAPPPAFSPFLDKGGDVYVPTFPK